MLTGKIALVTGAARGIGCEIAKLLAKNGATVLINYCGSEKKAQEVVEEITTQGGHAKAYQCDVSNFQDAENMVKQILEEYKKVDILVNNAGVTRDNLIMRMSEQEYDTVLDTNLKGAFHMIRHLSRSFLKQRSGRIINISSISGLIGNVGQANYAASKAGLIGMTKSIAREFAGRGICVNAIAPGFINTDMTQALTEETKSNLLEKIPMGRMGTAKDVANLVLFLCSDLSDYITGQVISVDGGMYM